jgi:hypothetical protein
LQNLKRLLFIKTQNIIKNIRAFVDFKVPMHILDTLTPDMPLIQLWCARSKWNMDLKRSSALLYCGSLWSGGLSFFLNWSESSFLSRINGMKFFEKQCFA